MKLLEIVGQYTLFLISLFRRPERRRVFLHQTIHEMNSIGVGSFGIVSLISIFTGMVSTIQIGVQLVDSLVPEYILGRIVRDSNILEFSPTITCLVLAGKVGSSIASEIGTMKVTEQVDALEIMGINSANYLVLPKILAGIITIPILVTYAMGLSIIGGAISGMGSGIISIDVHGYRTEGGALEVGQSSTRAVVYGAVMVIIFDYILSEILLSI